MKKITKATIIALIFLGILFMAILNYRITATLIIFFGGISFFTENKKSGLKKKQIIFQN